MELLKGNTPTIFEALLEKEIRRIFKAKAGRMITTHKFTTRKEYEMSEELEAEVYGMSYIAETPDWNIHLVARVQILRAIGNHRMKWLETNTTNAGEILQDRRRQDNP